MFIADCVPAMDAAAAPAEARSGKKSAKRAPTFEPIGSGVRRASGRRLHVEIARCRAWQRMNAAIAMLGYIAS